MANGLDDLDYIKNQPAISFRDRPAPNSQEPVMIEDAFSGLRNYISGIYRGLNTPSKNNTPQDAAEMLVDGDAKMRQIDKAALETNPISRPLTRTPSPVENAKASYSRLLPKNDGSELFNTAVGAVNPLDVYGKFSEKTPFEKQMEETRAKNAKINNQTGGPIATKEEDVAYYADGLDRMMNATSFGPGTSNTLRQSKLDEYARQISEVAEKQGIKVTAGEIIEKYAARGADPLPEDKVQAAALLTMQAIPKKGDTASAPLESYAAELGVDPKDVQRRIDKIGDREAYLKKQEQKEQAFKYAENRAKDRGVSMVDSKTGERKTLKQINEEVRGRRKFSNALGVKGKSRDGKALTDKEFTESVLSELQSNLEDKYRKYSDFDKGFEPMRQTRSGKIKGGPSRRQMEYENAQRAIEDFRRGDITQKEFEGMFRKDGSFSGNAYERFVTKRADEDARVERQNKADQADMNLMSALVGNDYKTANTLLITNNIKEISKLESKYNSMSPDEKQAYNKMVSASKELQRLGADGRNGYIEFKKAFAQKYPNMVLDELLLSYLIQK